MGGFSLADQRARFVDVVYRHPTTSTICIGQLALGLTLTFELHLFDGRGGESTWKTSLELLSHQDFAGLKERIDHRGARAYAHTYRTLLSDLQFDPFSSGHGDVFRPSFIAWMAAHKTDQFVEVTLARIRTLLDDEEFIRLVRDLTQRSACDFPE